MFELSIIIVTFNSEKYIEKCLDSIEKNNILDEKINTIIIDNYSSDNTIQSINKFQGRYKTICLIENKKNVGFAKAVNQGIKKCINNSRYILLLNPDTILNKKALLNLISCSKDNSAEICGGVTINVNGFESGSYFRFPNMMVGIFDFTNLRKLCVKDKWHKYFYYLDSRKNTKAFPVDVVTGGYMLIDSSIFSKIGLFDERFFMYLEDVDFCLRAKKNGIRIYHSKDSRIIHEGGASSNNLDKIKYSSWLMSRKLYFFKHFGLLSNLIIQPLFILDDLLILILILFRK